MSSAGHVLDAMKRQQKNREMQRYACDKYRSKLQKLYADSGVSSQEFDSSKFGGLTLEQKNTLRRVVRVEMRQVKIQSFGKSLVLIIVLIGVW